MDSPRNALLDDGRTEFKPDRTGWVAAGGILGAIAASSCCILPLTLFSLGASGAWIGNLAALAPYQPTIVVITIGFIGTGFYLVYRRTKAADCDVDDACANPISQRWVKSALWTSSLLVVAAVVFNFIAPVLLEL